jgi:type IV secretion system protein VirD4
MTAIGMTVVFLGAGVVAGGCKWRIGWLAGLSFLAVAGTGAFLVLRHGAWPLVPPALAWLALVFAWWAFIPRDDLPRNRVRRQNIRLHLRLHPGRGQATIFELHRHWGRLASARKARYARPNLTTAERLMRPDEHSVFLGRAQYRHGLRLPVEEHAAVFSPPRTGKTGWLSSVVLHYPGSVLSTTTRADVYKDTLRARSAIGRVDVFNPQRVGGVPSTMRFDVIRGCEDPAVAIRRAEAFAGAVASKGVEGGEFWAQKSGDYLRALFFAAAYARRQGVMLGLAAAARWALTDASREAEEILVDAGAYDWAAQVHELQGAAERTAATIRMYMSHALGFLMDPALAEAVTPDPDDPGLDLESFARGHDTLYVIATGQGEKSPLAPLFACIASEIHFTAGLVGSWSASGRLPSPMLFGLDEVTQICPVDLPGWLADSGGKGIQILAVAHGMAQLRKRWGDDGAQIVMDTVGSQIVLPGIKDPRVLKDLSEACGDVSMRERGQRHYTQHRVMTPAMIRELPDKHALVIRGNRAPVVCKVRQIWRDRLYKKLRGAPLPAAAQQHRTAPEPLAPVTLHGQDLGEPVPALESPAMVSAAADSGQFPWTTGAQ